MTAEQLEQANKVNGQIALIDEVEKDAERFKKTRFTGSLPTSVNRYIKENPDVAMKVVDLVVAEAQSRRSVLQSQWSAI